MEGIFPWHSGKDTPGAHPAHGTLLCHCQCTELPCGSTEGPSRHRMSQPSPGLPPSPEKDADIRRGGAGAPGMRSCRPHPAESAPPKLSPQSWHCTAPGTHGCCSSHTLHGWLGAPASAQPKSIRTTSRPHSILLGLNGHGTGQQQGQAVPSAPPAAGVPVCAGRACGSRMKTLGKVQPCAQTAGPAQQWGSHQSLLPTR